MSLVRMHFLGCGGPRAGLGDCQEHRLNAASQRWLSSTRGSSGISEGTGHAAGCPTGRRKRRKASRISRRCRGRGAGWSGGNLEAEPWPKTAKQTRKGMDRPAQAPADAVVFHRAAPSACGFQVDRLGPCSPVHRSGPRPGCWSGSGGAARAGRLRFLLRPAGFALQRFDPDDFGHLQAGLALAATRSGGIRQPRPSPGDLPELVSGHWVEAVPSPWRCSDSALKA